MKRSAGLTLSRIAALCAYGVVVMAPTIISYITGSGEEERSLILQAGLTSSLIAYPMLALQPVLSARLGWPDRLFGLDRVLSFHRTMAIVSGVLILIHPTALALESMSAFLFTSLYVPWYFQLGKLGFLILLVLIFSSLLHRLVHHTYERWRNLHNALALALLLVGIIHAVLAGRDMATAPMRVVFFALFASGIGFYIAHKIVGPSRRKKRLFHVADIARENSRVWTLGFKPSPTAHALQHLPGQFQFITPAGDGRLPAEEHPFTISSFYAKGDIHTSTIKESGDFTSDIGELQPGDPIIVQGPFGRFSYLLYPDERDFVFIAGGIGITPLMSMLRHMAITKADAQVVLIYANRSAEDITFRDELDRIAQGGAPRLSVIHVLETPPPAWQHETGRIDRALIEQKLEGDIREKAFYICGPPPMMLAIMKIARQLGVPRRRIHWERFAL
jgi:predicted ferric reductase